MINCAAWTAVDKAETEPAACRAANVHAVAALADACRDVDALFVQISSDYVFGADAARKSPYGEGDATAVQSREQLDEAAAQIEQRGEQISNVTYSAPDESGEPQITEADAAKLQSFLENQSVPRVGRNDPCPCGSGKKYKQCHGRLS